METQILEKRCSKCGETKIVDQFGIRRSKVKKIERRGSWCKRCVAANTAAYNARDPEEKKRRQREYLARRTDEERQRQNRMAVKRYRKEHAAKKHQKFKIEVLSHYGGQLCNCCGETEILMLSLDHIDGNGADHRRTLSGGRSLPNGSYRWAKRNNYPPIFQVLCMNCNWARHWNNGVCPHQEQRLRLAA